MATIKQCWSVVSRGKVSDVVIRKLGVSCHQRRDPSTHYTELLPTWYYAEVRDGLTGQDVRAAPAPNIGPWV